MPPSVVLVHGIGELVARYDAFLLDVWGVLHDGTQALPGAVESLGLLRRAGKQVGLLTNAPRRAARIAEQLQEMGITRGLYDFLVVSGELAHACLELRDGPASTWARCFFIGPPHNLDLIEGLRRPLDLCGPEKADFVLLTNVFKPSDTLERYRPLLTRARARDLPMVCANPDLKCMIGSRLVLGAGSIAHYYETLGGQVHYYGKPHPHVYEAALRQLPPTLERARIVAVGDSLRTDILGAASAGIDGVFVLSGVHRADFSSSEEEEEDRAQAEGKAGTEHAAMGTVACLCARHGIWPRYVIERLSA